MNRNWQTYDRNSPFSPLYPNVDVHYPKLNSRYGCMHSNFVLAFYDNGIRLCICTATFIFRDWQNMSNGVYVQDFPLKSATSPAPPVNACCCLLTLLARAR